MSFCASCAASLRSYWIHAGYNVRGTRHDFAVCTKSPPRFIHYNVAAYIAPELSLDISPVIAPFKSRLTIPIFGVTAGSLLFLVLVKLGQDVYELKSRVDGLQIASLEPTRPQIEPSTTTVTEIVTTIPTPARNRFLTPDLSGDVDSFFPLRPFEDSVGDLPAPLWVYPTSTTIATSATASPSALLPSSFPLHLASSRLGALITQPFRLPWLEFLRHSPALLFWKAWGILIMIFEFPVHDQPSAT